MCDPAGEAADALEPLRAPEVALELLALRHVAKHGDVQTRQNVRALHANSVSRTEPVGPDDLLAACPSQLRRCAPTSAEQLVARPAEELACSRVDVDVSPFVVRDQHRLEGAVEDGAEEVLALLALGDVDEEALLEEGLARRRRARCPSGRAPSGRVPSARMMRYSCSNGSPRSRDARSRAVTLLEIVRMNDAVPEALIARATARPGSRRAPRSAG